MARNRRWYAFALSVARLDANTRKQVVPSNQYRAHLGRIALLYRGIGEELDERGAPLRVFYFVAYAPEPPGVSRELGQQTRFRAVLEVYEEHGRWPLPPVLSALCLTVGELLGQPRPPASPIEAASPVDMYTEAAAASALMEQHPEVAAMLAEFADRRAYGPVR